MEAGQRQQAALEADSVVQLAVCRDRLTELAQCFIQVVGHLCLESGGCQRPSPHAWVRHVGQDPRQPRTTFPAEIAIPPVHVERYEGARDLVEASERDPDLEGPSEVV